MKPGILSFLALLVFAQQAICAPAKPVVCAYVFTRETPLTPGQVDPHKLTRINYAFANIDHGRIVEGAPATAGNLAILTTLRHDNPGLTVLISVGGWLWSGGFSDMALTSASRAAFIDSVAAFLTKYDLDGLDIDWEFPGMAGATNNFRAQDKQNYTALVKELRTRFDAMQKKTHRHLYLTIAAGANSDFLEHTEMGEVQKYVDTVNLMAYDYYEAGDTSGITGNHAPLFTDPADPKGISADRSVREYEQAGVPAEKIVLGVPFYGHVWGQVLAINNGLFQPGKPAPTISAHYADITQMLSQGYIRYWDKAASVPWLYSASKQIFVSYEDPESLSLKCRYVLDHHLGGIMFWDYFNDPSGALLGAIDTTLSPRVASKPGKP